MSRGYERVEGSIGRSYDEMKGVTMPVSRNFHMLSEITTGKKIEKLECLSIASGKNGFRWVAGVGAGSREKRVARRC